MREIKFRMLEKIGGDDDGLWRWEYFDLPYDLGIDNEIFLGSEYHRQETLSQFTGLHDKNGKEIFEGDIVEFPFRKGKALGQIYFGYDGWLAKSPVATTKRLNEIVYSSPEYNCEVIGNIYETPQLLTQVETKE